MIVFYKKYLIASATVLVLAALEALLIHDTIVCHGRLEHLLRIQPPEIVGIQFGDTEGNTRHGNWVELKRKTTIRVTLNGPATMVEFYVTPTGTQTMKLQRLIGVVYPVNGVAEYTWDVPENTMGHFWVVAYNRNVGRKSEAVNVIREELK